MMIFEDIYCKGFFLFNFFFYHNYYWNLKNISNMSSVHKSLTISNGKSWADLGTYILIPGKVESKSSIYFSKSTHKSELDKSQSLLLELTSTETLLS